MPCVWCVAYERSKRLGRTDRLLENQPKIDWRLMQTSAWLNYVTGRYRPGDGKENGA